MTFRPSLFEPLPLRLPVAEEATGCSSSASGFSDRSSANRAAGSFPSGAGDVSNLPASVSYQSNNASPLAHQSDRTRNRRIVSHARSTRNGHGLPQVNLSRTSAAVYGPCFVRSPDELRPSTQSVKRAALRAI
ncbi:MAG TPA: hypothetical protein VF634_08760 [Pyrinomonadaceae bacterium]